jgi:excisionase family DNA binding protein
LESIAQIPDEAGITPPKLLVTAEYVAGMLGVRTSWVREKTRSGDLPNVRLGRYVRYDLRTVRDWIEKQAQQGGKG